MFNLFKRKAKKETELDFFKQFFNSDFEHFVKIHFPIVVYTELPFEPRIRDWKEQRQYIIDNLIPESFKREFENSYSNYEGQRFQIIEKRKSGDINLSERDELVFQFLESQPKRFLKASELNQSEHEMGDFNVFPQYLDDTPDDIFQWTLEAIHSEFPDSSLTWQRFTDRPAKLELTEVLKDTSDMEPLNHLDKIYDEDGNWQLMQPEESSFLLLGTNSINLVERLNRRVLEIEKMKN